MISCGEIVSQSDEDKKIGAMLECITPERCDREGWCFRWPHPDDREREQPMNPKGT